MAPTPQCTDADLRQYREQGFFITNPLFDDAYVTVLRQEMHRIWADHIEATRSGSKVAHRLARERAFIPDLHLISPACVSFLQHPILRNLALKMIGPNVDVGYNQTVIKPRTGAEPNSFAWHQDTYYACQNLEWDKTIMMDDSRTFQGWFALTRTTAANGTLRVIPGGHRHGFLDYEQLPVTHEWSGAVDDSGAFTVKLDPGQLLVFSGLLPHCSAANVTDDVRTVYQFCYAEAGARTSDTILPLLRDGVPL